MRVSVICRRTVYICNYYVMSGLRKHFLMRFQKMTDSKATDTATDTGPSKLEWETPVITTLETEETEGTFRGGDEADYGMPT